MNYILNPDLFKPSQFALERQERSGEGWISQTLATLVDGKETASGLHSAVVGCHVLSFSRPGESLTDFAERVFQLMEATIRGKTKREAPSLGLFG